MMTTQQMVMAVQKWAHSTVVADDVGVFILGGYFYRTCDSASPFYLERAYIDILYTWNEHT